MRRFLPLLLIVLAACQASTVTPEMAATALHTTAPDALTITPSATQAVESTVTDVPTLTLAPTLAPSPLPTVMRPEALLPSANLFGLRPNGANSVLGLGFIADPVVSPDESLIALTTSLGVTVLDTATLQERWSMITNEYLFDFVWSPDGSKIAMVHGGDLVTVHDAQTGRLLAQLPLARIDSTPAYSQFSSAAWSMDNITLAITRIDTVVWNTVTDQMTTGFGDSFYAYWLAKDRLGLHLPAYQFDALTVWDTTTGEELWRYSGYVRDWSPDFTLVRAIASDSTDEVVINIAADEQLLIANSAASFSLNWDRAAVVREESVEVVELGPDRVGQILHRLEVGAIARYTQWSPDSKKLVVGTRYFTQVWDMQSGELLCTLQGIGLAHNDNHDEPLVHWFLDGQSFIIALPDEHLTVWDATTCAHNQTIPTSNRFVPHVASIDFVDQGRRLWVNDSTSLRLWDVQLQQPVYELVDNHRFSIIGWAENSRHVIQIGLENVVVWDIQTGIPLESMSSVATALAENHSPPARFERGNWFSPDETYYVKQGYDSLEIVSSASNQVLYQLPVELSNGGSNGSIAWTADGRLMAANLFSGVYLWDTQTWQRVAEWHGPIFGGELAFSPDGQWLAVDVEGAIVVYPVP